MVLQIVLVQDVVDEAGRPRPVVLGQRIGERQRPGEVGVLLGQLVELIHIEGLAQRARTVPEADLALGLQALELVEDVRAHGRHAGTAADEHHLVVGLLGEELAERTIHRDLVARLQVEHPRGHLARRNVVAALGRGRGHPDVELDDAFLARIVGHGIGPDDRLVHAGNEAPQIELVPVGTELVLDVEVLVGHFVRRTFQLHVAAGAEVHALALGQAQRQLLDEGGDVEVGFDRAFPLAHAEHFFGHADLHVLLDRGLAGKAPAFGRVTPREVGFFGGQHLAAAGFDDALALGTRAAATAGRGQEDVLTGQGLKQLAAGRHRDLAFAVDLDGDVAAGDQPRTRHQDQHHQRQHDHREHADPEQDFRIHERLPPAGLVRVASGITAGPPRTT